MIKYICQEGRDIDLQIVMLYAGTKSEVPTTGAATQVVGYAGKINPGSFIYTKAVDVAVLGDDDKWGWL